jgi:hypothetical protein
MELCKMYTCNLVGIESVKVGGSTSCFTEIIQDIELNKKNVIFNTYSQL